MRTRDLDIMWPHRHTLTFEGAVSFDMRYVCPKDVKKMLVPQARSVYWLQWAAKHGYEELKEGVWLEPALAFLRVKTRKSGLKKHRNVAKNFFSGRRRGCRKKSLFHIGWSDESECQACHKEEGTEKHRFYHCPEWYEVRREIPEAFRKWEQKARTL